MSSLSVSRDPETFSNLQPRWAHRVLFLQHSSLADGYGGVEYYLDDFTRLSAASLGAESTLNLLPRRNPKSFEFDYPTQFIPFSSNRWISKLQNRYSASYFRAARRAIAAFRPTVIFNSHASLGPLAYVLSRASGIPFVTCAYGIEVWGNLKPQDEFALRRADRIVSISHWTKKVLTERGYDAKRIDVVHPQLPSSLEKIVPGDPRTNGPLTLLTISRLDAREQYKGHDHVLRALSELKRRDPAMRVRYIIQGDGSDRPRLQKIVRELNLSTIVDFRPPVSDRAALEKTYREADLFVMPSRYGRWGRNWRGEGFGIVYVEAAAFGVPSIAYNCGGATDIIHHGENGFLIPPDDIVRLTDTIRHCANERFQLVEMGKMARRMAIENFGENSIRRELVAAFDQISPKNP